MAKWVYMFSEGDASMRNTLGGKGANLAEMTKIIGADVVPQGLQKVLNNFFVSCIARFPVCSILPSN